MNFLDLPTDTINIILSFCVDDNVSLKILIFCNKKLHLISSCYGKYHYYKERRLNCDDIAKNGYLEILKLTRPKPSDVLRERKIKFYDDKINRNNLKLTKDNINSQTDNYVMDNLTFAMASKYGHNDILKWMKENKCPYDSLAFLTAAQNGHIETLKLLKEINCPIDFAMCNYAAGFGHLDVLKWFRYSFDDDLRLTNEWSYVYVYAAKYDHLEILKWLKNNVQPLKSVIVSKMAYL